MHKLSRHWQSLYVGVASAMPTPMGCIGRAWHLSAKTAGTLAKAKKDRPSRSYRC